MKANGGGSTRSKVLGIYMRVSSEDQEERDTIENQRIELLDWLEAEQRRDPDIRVHAWYEDEDVSGKLPLDQRLGARQLLEDARNGLLGTMVTYNVKRYSRNAQQGLADLDKLDSLGIVYRSATEPFDTSTIQGRKALRDHLSDAEWDRDYFLEITGKGRDRHVRYGKWFNVIGFGFSVDTKQRLIPSERIVEALGITEAALAAQIFERLAAGSSTVDECKRLNALGVPTTRYYTNGTSVNKNAPWRPSRINKMVRNTLYYGLRVFHSRYGDKSPLPGYEPPALVSLEIWKAANATIDGNKAVCRREGTRQNLLRGKVVCTCGMRFVGTVKEDRPYYRCGGQLGAMHPGTDNRCKAKMIPAEWLENIVWSDVREYILHPGDALEVARQQLAARLAKSAGMEAERTTLARQLSAKEQERQNILTAYRRGLCSIEDLETQIAAIQRETTDQRIRLEAIRSEQEILIAFEERHVTAASMLARMRNDLERLDQQDDWQTRRDIVDALVRSVIVTTQSPDKPHGRKRASLTIHYTLDGKHAVDVTTDVCDGIYSTMNVWLVRTVVLGTVARLRILSEASM